MPRSDEQVHPLTSVAGIKRIALQRAKEAVTSAIEAPRRRTRLLSDAQRYHDIYDNYKDYSVSVQLSGGKNKTLKRLIDVAATFPEELEKFVEDAFRNEPVVEEVPPIPKDTHGPIPLPAPIDGTVPTPGMPVEEKVEMKPAGG